MLAKMIRKPKKDGKEVKIKKNSSKIEKRENGIEEV
jgi:hypothetical protein